jgi:hypothetical protein
MPYLVGGELFATRGEALSYLNSELAAIKNGTYKPRCPEYSTMRRLLADHPNHSELIGTGLNSIVFLRDRRSYILRLNRRDGEVRSLTAKQLLNNVSAASSDEPVAPAAVPLPEPVHEESLEMKEPPKKKKKKRNQSVRNIVGSDEEL